MPDNYYPEMGGEPPVKEQPEGEDDSEGTTALLPKSVLGGKNLKAGDTVTVTVKHVYEDEVEIETKTVTAEDAVPPPQTDNQELDTMSEEGED